MSLVKIYVEIIDGTITYVPCQAEHFGENKYKIHESQFFDLDDDTCIWGYFPNDVVTIKKKKFPSDNSGMVANELISYEYADRLLYKLVYDIISENISQDLNSYGDALSKICDEAFVYGKKYPPVQEWLKGNCIKQ